MRVKHCPGFVSVVLKCGLRSSRAETADVASPVISSCADFPDPVFVVATVEDEIVERTHHVMGRSCRITTTTDELPCSVARNFADPLLCWSRSMSGMYNELSKTHRLYWP